MPWVVLDSKLQSEMSVIKLSRADLEEVQISNQWNPSLGIGQVVRDQAGPPQYLHRIRAARSKKVFQTVDNAGEVDRCCGRYRRGRLGVHLARFRN